MKLLVIVIFGGLNNDGGDSRRSTRPVCMFKGIALWLWCTLGIGRTYIWRLEAQERLGFVVPCFVQDWGKTLLDGFYVSLATTLTFLIGESCLWLLEEVGYQIPDPRLRRPLLRV